MGQDFRLSAASAECQVPGIPTRSGGTWNAAWQSRGGRSMGSSLGAIFYYADGCSRWVPECLPDPPPSGIDLRGNDFTPGSHHFRSQAVHQEVGEAWYAEITGKKTN